MKFFRTSFTKALQSITDGRTDRRTDGRTDTRSYRDARTHLKNCPHNHINQCAYPWIGSVEKILCNLIGIVDFFCYNLPDIHNRKPCFHKANSRLRSFSAVRGRHWRRHIKRIDSGRAEQPPRCHRTGQRRQNGGQRVHRVRH